MNKPTNPKQPGQSLPLANPDQVPNRSKTANPDQSGQLKKARWAAASGFFGAIAEYYDFALYAPASALFLGALFFEPLGEQGARLAAYASFAVAYLARPLGAVLFGHFGDRVGRKKVMLFTLAMMGVSTVLIGLLPTYQTAGIFAPIALVVLRIMQGLSAGVEQSGSGTLSAEQAPKNRRAVYTSWTMIGVAIGWFLGPAVLAPISVHQSWLMAGGWRVPFLIAAPMLAFSLWIRTRVSEPEQAVKARGRQDNKRAQDRFPLFEILSHYPSSLMRVIGCSLHMLVGVTVNVFMLAWAVDHAGMDRAAVLLAISIAGISTAFLQPLWAWISDLLGRRVVFIASCLGLIVLLPVVFQTLYTKNLWLVTFSLTVFYVVVMAGNVVQASFYPELFPAHVRLSGVSIGTQSGLVIVGASPVIYQLLVGDGNYGFWPGWAFAALCWLVAAGCAWSAPETAPRKLKSGQRDLLSE